MAATVPSGRPGRLLVFTDTSSKQWFLVDTGSAYSIIPHQSTAAASGPAIVAADRTPIPCWGSCKRTITAGGQRFTWSFLKAAVAFPILGADFLAAFDLMVDLKRGRLVRANRSYVPLSAPPPGCTIASIGVVAAGSSAPSVDSSSPAVESPAGGRPKGRSKRPRKAAAAGGPPSPSVDSSTPSVGPSTPSVDSSSPSVDPPVGGRPKGRPKPPQAAQPPASIADSFPEVVNSSKKLPPVKHKVQHVIETTCQRPISSRYRRLAPGKLEAAKKEFAEMEAQGIIRKAKGSWASPLHMVEKADGTWRPCGDYRLLNIATKPDLYPPPHMEDLSARLSGKKVFSKLDLRKGYYQVPVAPKDIEKTAVITPFGLYEFLRMPFGLRNAGQSFQRFMDEVLLGIPHTFVYLDDILVASETAEQHQEDLKEVLQRLQEFGLVLNHEKCVFNASQVEFLGHVVDATGIKPLPARVSAISSFPQPTTKGELQRFLGMINYYRRFLSGAASILKPLTDATRGAGGRQTALSWTKEMQQAFKKSKAALAQAAELIHPDPAAEISLAVDASDHHVGGVLQQQSGGTWAPLAFFSRKLTEAEARYSTFDRELLACVAAIKHFRYLLEGQKFFIWSDHKPLTYALHRVSDPWSARQQRHLAYVAEYTSEIRHVAGADNVVADSLSRPPAVADQPPAVGAVVPPASTGPLNWTELAAEQATCEQLQQLQKSSSLQLQLVSLQDVPVWCDVSTGAIRPLIPRGHRRAVFDSIHSLAHPGTRASTRLISSRFVWPALATDVKEWCRECVACQRAKVTSQPSTPVEKISIPAQRFSHVHVDLVGPWPTARAGYRYLLTVIDRSTRWFEATPLQEITAEVVLDSFITSWVARFGLPAHVTTDRGAQFTSGTWTTWCTEMQVEHITTTAFHPQANGMVERLHRQIKDALRARGAATAWADHLPWVILGLRAAPKDESGVSAAEATLGQPLVIPGQPTAPEGTVPTALRAPPAVIPATKRSYAEVAASPSALDAADWVYVRRGPAGTPLADKYEGPFHVLARGPKFFKLKMGEREDTVSRDRLKPHMAVVDPVPAALRGRGRPPGKSLGDTCSPPD